MLLASRMSTPIPEQQLIEMLTRNLLPEIRHELLYVQIRSIAHLRKLVQMRENLLGEVATRRFPKPAPNPVFSRRNVAALEDDNSIQDTDPNLGDVDAIQAPIKIYRCWNCDGEGHGWDMCLENRKVFCYGCGAKNIYKPQCPNCLAKRAEKAKGPFVSQTRTAPKQH